jgi:hypothetical protein
VDFILKLFFILFSVKVINLFQQGKLELLPRVFVFYGSRLHLDVNLLKAITESVEDLLAKRSTGAIVGALHGS